MGKNERSRSDMRPFMLGCLLLLASMSTTAHEFRPNCYGWPSTNRDWSTATAGADLPRLINNNAPKFALKTLAQDKTVSLDDLLKTAPVVMAFADYS